MALTVFPTTPKPAYSYILDHQYKTLISDFEEGEEGRNKRWPFPKRTFNVVYKLMAYSTNQRDQIYEFYQNRLGTYEPFWYFDLQNRKWVDQKVGYGDGATTLFDLPGNSTSPTIYINGASTTGWTLSTGGGEGGADQITFDSAVSSGGLITCDFAQGYLRIKARFKDDRLTEEITTKHLVNFSVSVIEVKNT